MIRIRPTARLAGLSLGLLVAAAAPAAADGMPPFYGYSGYFGAPTPYYTHDLDVQRSTRMVEGYQGFGEATYTTGGPFWGYKSHRRVVRERRVRHTVRVKG